MPWVRLSDTFAERAVWDDLGMDACVLHIAGLGYSNRQGRDGRLPRRAVLRLLGLDDPTKVADQLVAAGVWAADVDGGYRIVHDLEDQLEADEVERMRERQKQRQRRQRRHRNGDHDECDPRYCPVSRDMSRDKQRDVTRESRDTDPTRPDPTRRVGDGEEERGDGAGSAAPPTTQAADTTPPPPNLRDIYRSHRGGTDP